MEEGKKTEKNALAAEEKNNLVIPLRKSIKYEGTSYDEIDLSGMHEIKASDMIAINRRLTRSGNVDASQEISLEYALNIANTATGIPLEFFEQLPPYAALAIKGRVTSFLFGRE